MVLRQILIYSAVLSLVIVSCRVVGGETQVSGDTFQEGQQTPDHIGDNQPTVIHATESAEVDHPTSQDPLSTLNPGKPDESGSINNPNGEVGDQPTEPAPWVAPGLSLIHI